MGQLYRRVLPDGSIELTDVPQGAGYEAVRPGQPGRPDETQQRSDHKVVEDTIKAARKHGPKLLDYLDYIAYLRQHNPHRFDRVMRELMANDPKTWVALQKFPQFRPLRDTLVGVKSAEKYMGLAVDIVRGNLSGGTMKVFETTLKDMMKRDRFGPYLDVLGSKASTLPPPKPPTYSNSRFGQYLKREDARQATVAKEVARELDASRKALRGAVATSVTRVAGPLLDLGTQMLNPEVAVGLTQTLLRARMDKLAVRNPDFAIDTPEYEEARSLLSQGRMGELDRLLKRFE